MVRIKKVYDKHFTVINNSILNDTSLKWEDKGLFTYLWSQADEWDFYAKEVAKHSPDSEDKVYKILRKLEEHGYLLRERQRNKSGQLKSNKWLLSEKPNQKWINIYKKRIEKRKSAKSPIRQNPEQVKPDLVKPNVVKTDLTNTNLNNYQHKQIKNLNNLSLEEAREKKINELLTKKVIKYYEDYSEYWHKPKIKFSENEKSKIKKAVAGKDLKDLNAAVEKAVMYSEQYPQGYLISCLRNVGKREKVNESSK